jgi:lipopolysaccharide/colanic/teichoic acid biosynthesis glycosyltransferase
MLKLQFALKRIFDILLSFAGITVFLPAFVLLWLFIKMDSNGPGFILQERMGKDRKIFKMLKFRTMFYNPNGMDYRLNPDNFLQQTSRNDRRITRIGKKIRKLHLDELPQLFNVLAGQMCLVGPRPAIFLRDINPEVFCEEKTAIRPGMTGLAQVSGGIHLPFSEERRYDAAYINNYSFFLDLRIIYQTILSIVRGEGIKK